MNKKQQHNMNRLLCLGLGMWLTIAMADGIKCYNCKQKHAGKACSEPLPPCELQEGESCYRQNAFLGERPLYVKAGCLQDCEEKQSGPSPPSKCCSDSDFCNQ